MPKSTPATEVRVSRLISPIPGQVNEIKAAVGGKVRKNQILLKIRNVGIRSPRSGIIAQISVKPGDWVIPSPLFPLMEITTTNQ